MKNLCFIEISGMPLETKACICWIHSRETVDTRTYPLDLRDLFPIKYASESLPPFVPLAVRYPTRQVSSFDLSTCPVNQSSLTVWAASLTRMLWLTPCLFFLILCIVYSKPSLVDRMAEWSWLQKEENFKCISIATSSKTFIDIILVLFQRSGTLASSLLMEHGQ